MGFEPAFQAAGGAVSKQIDDLMILKVDQNGAIGDIATKRPIVYAKMGWGGMFLQRCSANEPQKGIGTTSGLEHAGDASAPFAAQGKGQCAEHLDEAERLAGIAQRHLGDRLGKGLARAEEIITEKAQYLYLRLHGQATTRKVL